MGPAVGNLICLGRAVAWRREEAVQSSRFLVMIAFTMIPVDSARAAEALRKGAAA